MSRLDGLGELLPSVDLFVAMYVKKEAVLSSQIEGTQASLIDILDYEATGEQRKDVDEVVNYVSAMNKGLQLLPQLPISLRLIREIHKELLKGVRGNHKSPGAFRTSQNWIGSPNGTLKSASFIPPPPHEMKSALSSLEKFIHSDTEFPPLVHNALVHSQFETIHPFLDGNGRIGRLLITFLLVEQKILQRPLLYLSHYFKQYRSEYYQHLNSVRFQGAWESWVKFFLRGVAEVSLQATDTAKRIIQIQQKDRDVLAESANALKVIESLYRNPITNLTEITKTVGCSHSTAARIAELMIEKGVIKETTGNVRNKRFIHQQYLDLLSEGLTD